MEPVWTMELLETHRIGRPQCGLDNRIMRVPIGLQHRDLPGIRILCIPDVTASGLKARLDTPLLADLQKLDCSKNTICPGF